jgi:PmbA protein
VNEKKEYLDLALWAVEEAKKGGADGAEAFVVDSESVSISVSGRQVEQVNAVRDSGIGVRVMKDNKIAFGSTNDLSRPAVQSMVGDLVRKVPFHSADEFNVLAGKDGALDRPWGSYADRISFDPRIAEVPVEEKIRRAIALEAAGLDSSPKIKSSMVAAYQDSSQYIYLANSNGLSGSWPSSGCGGGAEFAAAEGADQQSGSFQKASPTYAGFDPAEVGRKAADNAVKMLGAKPIPSCEVPMVVNPEVGTQLLSFIAGLLSADEVQKGRSLFAGKTGTPIASAVVTLVDDGLLSGRLATSPVDGEGVPQQTTVLVADGTLKTFLYDSYTANKGKTRSTGNRQRGSYQGQGGVGTTNFYLKPGSAKADDLVRSVRRGFYWTQGIGLFAGIDAASGDFSIPVAGFLIEKGKLTAPIRGITIAGNLFTLLQAVDRIADDLTWLDPIGCPTFSVKSVKIGGA